MGFKEQYLLLYVYVVKDISLVESHKNYLHGEIVFAI